MRIFRTKVRVTFVVDKLKEGRLRWFVNVKRRCADALMRKCEMLDIVGSRRGRGKLEKYWGK